MRKLAFATPALSSFVGETGGKEMLLQRNTAPMQTLASPGAAWRAARVAS